MNELERLEADPLVLVESLEETADENVEAWWADEIRRRDEDLRSGRASARPVDDVLREACERLPNIR